MNRRDLLIASAAVTGSALTMRLQQRKYSRDLRPSRSRIAILHTDHYADHLDELVYDGLRPFNLDVHGKSILLKPNIVEYIRGKPVNTDPQLIGATAEAFLRLDAASVTVGEGPGHHRDTELLLYETGLGDQLVHRKIAFVDLNRDELVKTRLRANYSGVGHLCLPRTVLASDFIVSMPKLKTHHWTGVTLSMKNMFGIVPGSRYGRKMSSTGPAFTKVFSTSVPQCGRISLSLTGSSLWKATVRSTELRNRSIRFYSPTILSLPMLN